MEDTSREANVEAGRDDERIRLLEEWQRLALSVEAARDKARISFVIDPGRGGLAFQEALQELQQTETLSHEAWLRFLKAANLENSQRS